MRISKIESDYMLQTPTTPIHNRSYVEIYNEDDGVSIRPIARLDPEYPIVESSISEGIHERFPRIDLPVENIDSQEFLYPKDRDHGDLSVIVAPGTRYEEEHNYLDWEDLTGSIKPRELKDVFSNIVQNEVRVYEDDLYEMASTEIDSLEQESFSDWLSEKPSFVYQSLVRNCRPGGLNEFEVNGAFHRQVDEAEFSQNLEGGLIMEGSRQIGVVENQTEDVKYGLKSIDGVIVPEQNETVESFLERFSQCLK